MGIVVWFLKLLLGLIFLLSGSIKVLQTKEKLQERMAWVEDFAPQTIRSIGILEVSMGLVLVWSIWSSLSIPLTPLAALGIVVTMIGGMVVHARRGEILMLCMNALLGAMAAFVAYVHF